MKICDWCYSNEMGCNTGETQQNGFIDCPVCGAADERRALNDWADAKSQSDRMTLSDQLWLVHQRAVEQERAKARAALLRIQAQLEAGAYEAHEGLRDELARIAS